MVKWLLPEDGQQQAYVLQDLFTDEKLNLIAPPLLIAEVGNALTKRSRRGELSVEVAKRLFQALTEDAPVLVDFAGLYANAFKMALAHRRSIYDCVYLTLAVHHGCDLVTADEKFVTAMAPAFPAVQLLKSYVPPANSNPDAKR